MPKAHPSVTPSGISLVRSKVAKVIRMARDVARGMKLPDYSIFVGSARLQVEVKELKQVLTNHSHAIMRIDPDVWSWADRLVDKALTSYDRYYDPEYILSHTELAWALSDEQIQALEAIMDRLGDAEPSADPTGDHPPEGEQAHEAPRSGNGEEAPPSGNSNKAVKKPPRWAFAAWEYYHLHGMKQESVARTIREKFGIPLFDQSRVSKGCKQVREYLGAGNPLPELKPLTVTMDPQRMALGRRVDLGRVDRRGKKDDD